jgi:hypothetical protein
MSKTPLSRRRLLLDEDDAQLVAVCDVFEDRRKDAAAPVNKHGNIAIEVTPTSSGRGAGAS